MSSHTAAIQWSGNVRPEGVGDCECPPEVPSYLSVGGEQLYTVRHPAHGEPRGKVLLVGPFPSQRLYTYISWISWARLLAANGYEVLRFDYRGTGESTGRFEDMSFGTWLDDIGACAEHLDHGESVPLVLHGLLLGGLLANIRFKSGCGDGLMLWEPAPSGAKLLNEFLRGKLTEDMALQASGLRKNRQVYIDEILAGEVVEVDGYPWTKNLWESTAGFDLELPDPDSERPWHNIRLTRRQKQRSLGDGPEWSIPIPTPPFWVNNQFMVPDLTDLFEQGLGAMNTLVQRIGAHS